MAGFPAEAWRQSAAPAWVDPTGGDASWVVAEADVKVLHWMCAVRDLDAGGKNEEMVQRLRDWDEAVGGGNSGDALQREWGPPPPYEEGSEGGGRRCIIAPICNRDEDSAMAVVVQVDGESALSGLDTWAEESVIRRGLVREHWKVRQKDGKKFDGLGSTGVKLGEEVEVPVQMRYGAELIHVVARVVEDSDMPDGVEMLFGTAFQRKARMVYDCDNMRVELRALGIVIDLEPMDELVARKVFEPLRVLELCAGMSGSYGILVDMGYRIAVWDAVESNSEVAEVARMTYPQLRHAGDDVAMFRVNGKYHLILAGPPCQPWSRAAGRSAKGFRDKRAKPFREVCMIVRECMEVNPDTAFMVENVVVNSAVAGDAEVQSRLLGAEFQEVTPTRLG